MPDQRFEGGARLSPEDASLIRFGMLAGGKLIRVDLPISVLSAEFGVSKLEPLDHFESHRDVIEATAGQAFGARPEPSHPLLMAATDFATPASRSHVTEQDV